MDDVGRLWTGIGVCAAVILLMAFLTLCENAAVEFNDAKLKKMAEEDKDPKAIRLAALLGRTGRVVATNLIARSIMIIAVSVVGAIYFYAPLSNKLHKLFDVYTQASYYIIGICSFVIISCLLALVICTFGVGIPKKLCISGKVGERFILNSCVAYKALLAVFSPLAAVSGAVSAGILRLFGIKSTNKAEESQAEMISNIFDFDDIEVREVMTHRTEMVAIEENSTLAEAVKLVIGEGFSRIPVYCDNADNISGVIFAKDLLRLVFEEDKKERPVKEFMRDITFVPESNKCGELFKEFTEDKTQIAVVVDDYGGTAGIITMEDLLETIVGSIQDEYDDETEEIQKVSSDCYDMVGTAAFDDVMEALGKEYHGEVDYDTIGGFVMDLLGHVPEDNEKVTVHWENVEFKVLSIHEKKIERLRAVIKRDNEEVTD